MLLPSNLHANLTCPRRALDVTWRTTLAIVYIPPMVTRTLSTRLPAHLVVAFREACELHGIAPAAIVGAFLEAWTPVAPGHRPVLPPELKTLLQAARGRKG